MAKTKELHITYTRSAIKAGTKMERTVRALGLTRMHMTVVHKDNAVIRGMIDKVKHLVTVKEVG